MQFSQCNTVFLIGHGIVGSEEIMLSDCQTSDFRVQQARLNRCCVRLSEFRTFFAISRRKSQKSRKARPIKNVSTEC